MSSIDNKQITCQIINKRLSLTRQKMIEVGLDAYILPSSDLHQSEYLPPHWQVREWISGFTGSAGTAMISKTMAGLWTDSRYWLQGEKELRDTSITLFKAGHPDHLMMHDYLLDHLSEGSKVGFNPFTTSVNEVKRWTNKLSAKDIAVVASHQVGIEVWETDGRPDPDYQPIYEHASIYAGRSITEKLDLVRTSVKDQGASSHLITTLDDIAWLFNLRGSDISNNPVFLSTAIIREKSATLYCSVSSLAASVLPALSQAGVEVKPYDDILHDLQEVDQTILIDPDLCVVGLSDRIPAHHVVMGSTPSRSIKACKTASQISHIEGAMIKDGVALAHAFYHLQQHLGSITEYEFAEKIADCRSRQRGYKGESFSAIVGYEANGAIVHYRPGPDSPVIAPKGLLLCDSGGQYVDGTTDITRTIAVGSTSAEQREMYTRVLKGHIALDQAVFPKGKVGRDLDVFARMHLWQAGRDFGHGTGHGVGYFLNVHEPPQSISPGKSPRANVVFQSGMLTSNEPGYYKDGEYGIRIENLIVCKESTHEGFLEHDHLTLFPFDTSIIERNILTRDEVRWINEYHKLCAKKLLPELTGKIKTWMLGMCEEI